jgi:Na+-transporting NADH:ubiquinone oxidoreductase subunit C
MHYKQMNPAKQVLLLLIVLLLAGSCKDTTQKEAPTPVQEVEAVKTLDPVFKEIGRFMGLEVTDSTRIDSVFSFRAITEEEGLVSSDAAQNLKSYKAIMRNGKATSLPVFEAKETNLSLLVFTGKGYIGTLWVSVLIDKNTGKTVRVRFGHQMESEGYGNGIMSSAFGDQFMDKQIASGDNTFGLMQNGKPAIEGANMVDGISGATVTSSAAVQMLNDGLKQYSSYLTAE